MYIANEKRYDNMEFSKSGKSGLSFPKVSLGLWHNFGSVDNYENMKEMCFFAFDKGITHFDLANNYGPVPGSAEENFGRILREEMGGYRDEMLISTKAGYYMWQGPYGDGGSRKYLISSLDQSLKRMGLDYVDVFYHHRMDPETPLEETMLALSQIVKSGKALYVGLSNYDGKTMKRAKEILDELKTPFVINQNRYNIFDRNIESNRLIQTAKEEGVGIICFSPLAQGLLTNRYLKGIPEGSRAKRNVFLKEAQITPEMVVRIEKLNKIAEARGQSLAQMALAWVLREEGVTSVLIGASSAEQINNNLKSVENISFSMEELKEIDRVAML